MKSERPPITTLDDSDLVDFEEADSIIKDMHFIAKAYYCRGIAYYKKACYELAIESLTEAIKLGPHTKPVWFGYSEPDARYFRGLAFAQQGYHDRAIADFDKVIQLEPNKAIAYNNRGGAYYLKEEYESAIKDFSIAIDLNPDDASTYNNRGVAYCLKKEYESAIADFSRAIDLNPDYAIAYNNRGRAYGAKGEADGSMTRPSSRSAKLAVIRAIKDYNPAIGLNPELAPAYYNRGVAWLCLREWERAKSDLTIARNMGIDIITLFRNDYESVESFEERNGVQLPKDILTHLLPAGKQHPNRK